jgi:hypothetical protein
MAKRSISGAGWVLALAGAAAACSPRFPYPTYDYQGIDLLAGVGGEVILDEGCLKLVSERSEEPFLLLFPRGTRLEGDLLTLPERNGGARFRLGERVSLQGGFNTLSPETTYVDNPRLCFGDVFIVNRTPDPQS